MKRRERLARRLRAGSPAIGALASCVVAMSAIASGCNLGRGRDATVAPADHRTPNATVVHIIDGDTIVAEVGGTEEHIRLIGINTPEIAHPEANKTADCYGPEATAYTAAMLPVGTSLHLERDVEGRDDYGRLLAYVFRADDGIFVNFELVRHGYATPLRFEPNITYADLFASAANDAHREHLGLWTDC